MVVFETFVQVLTKLKMIFIFALLLVHSVDGIFTNWNTWSSCTGVCGKGSKYRERVLVWNNETFFSTIIGRQDCEDKTCRALVNLSLKKSALASSQFLPAYPAGNAVDGITTNDLHENSCMHTAKEKNPWLRIDLGKAGLVEKVVIHNRADCCSDRLNNLVVHVGSQTESSKNQICGERGNMENVKKAVITCCTPMLGRYVHITIPGPQFLHLCEVEVLGKNSFDLAAGKQASQSTTRGTDTANNAIDGSFYTYSLTSKTVREKAWWKVDLGRVSHIVEVIVQGFAASEPSTNALVTVEDGKENKHVCGNTGLTFVATASIICPMPLKGRYVKIELQRQYHLVLREVKVMGIV